MDEMSGVQSFDPNEHISHIEDYLGKHLNALVQFMWAEPLKASSREAPWRLDVSVEGRRRSFILKLDTRRGEHEYAILRAMESVPIPTPRAYGWDAEGKALGMPCFFYDFLVGDSLLKHLLLGEEWAENLYIETARALQAVTREHLLAVAERFGPGETAADVLEKAWITLRKLRDPMLREAFMRLRETMPPLPDPRFSNGDLYPDNIVVRGEKLVGVIDFESAGFSDPIYEFLLPFFIYPELCRRGIEEEYCKRMGFDKSYLTWYLNLEYYDTLHWVLKTGKPFCQHTEKSLREALARWLQES